jgi:hypothetical protein
MRLWSTSMTFENFFSRKLLEHSTMDLRLFPRDSFDEASRGQSWIWSLRALKTIGLVRLTHCALFHSRWEAADVTHYRFVTVSYRHGLSAGSNPFRLGSTMTTALVCSFVQILPIEDPSSGAKPPIEGLTLHIGTTLSFGQMLPIADPFTGAKPPIAGSTSTTGTTSRLDHETNA